MEVGRSSLWLPEKQTIAMAKAYKLELITIGALFLDIFVMYFAMGSSQAMKTAWIDNVLSLTPPLVFLIAEAVKTRKPNERFEYGYYRINSIAFLVAAVALFSMGLFLVYESVEKLVSGERPTIGTIEMFGSVFWAGWPMVAAAALSATTAAIVGHLKLPLGKILHNKILYTDATMNKADLLTGIATIFGVIGVGFGFWWADAVAALIISVDILVDGYQNVGCSVADLIDRVPETVDTRVQEPIVNRVKTYVRESEWVKDSIVRFHEEGHLFFGEAFVVPKDERGLVSNVARSIEDVRKMDWRLADFTITPVPTLEGFADV